MRNFIKKQPPVRIIALGFALVILLGSVLLMMPFSLKDGVSLGYADALYTSTSAVCVTGLVVVDTGDTFSPPGQFILAMLIQIGGLGVAAVGAGVILMLGSRMDLKSRTLVREAMNLSSGRGVAQFVKTLFLTTLIFEFAGTVLSFMVFVKDYPPLQALGISAFHSVAAFNNAGFDVLGNFQSLTAYSDNVLLNLVTCGLIFFGGIGFLVIREMRINRFHWKKYSLHAKVVLTMSAVLIVGGMLLLKLTDGISWLEALFQSVSARTAGYSSIPMGNLSTAGILVMCLLMIIGASPGSTGGGIKTSTFFMLLQGIRTAATNKTGRAFRYTLPKDGFRKAAVITLLALGILGLGCWLLLMFDPQLGLRDVLFEMSSAVATVGLSTGITPTLSLGSKITSIVIMYIGRLGPLTVASLWTFSHGERVRYPEGNISIG